jgi:hypothetical protein
VFNLRLTDHITDALMCLHWQRVAAWITFKIAVMVYRYIHGQSPAYLTDFTLASVSRANLRSAASHRSSVYQEPVCRQLVTVPFWLMVLPSGTACLMTSSLHQPIHIFRARLKNYLFRTLDTLFRPQLFELLQLYCSTLFFRVFALRTIN